MDDELNPSKLAEANGTAARVKSHVDRDHTDQCGYCGQHFGPDNIVIQKEIFGREWAFCSEECYTDFREHSDFKDENLDNEPDVSVQITRED